VVGVAILLASFNASAISYTYDFYKITDNNTEDLSSQLSITLWSYDEANATFGTSLDDTQVLFTVTNNVGIDSNISEVYFDDGLLGPSVAINSLGGFTSFTGGSADPGNLPGGEGIDPVFSSSTNFSADVDPGSPTNGVDDAADILGISLGLGSYADADAVNAAVLGGDLRFGLHVRSIGTLGGSDSYVSPVPGEGVPVPSTLFLLGLGLLGLARMQLKRS
jgi:hypothetical protein